MSATLELPVHANPARSRPRALGHASAIAWIGALFLAGLAPFETLEPVIQLPWQSVSNLEAAIFLAGVAWIASLGIDRKREWWRTPLSAPWAGLLSAMFVSAILAPAWRSNALHMTGRMAVAAGVFLMTAAGAASPVRIRRLIELAAAVGVVVALLTILEFLSLRPVVDALRLFRADTSVVGAQVRATGTLQYPTIASMYLEITFAFALGLFASACAAGRGAIAVAWGVAMLLTAEAIVLTFTRAGLITMATSFLVVAAVCFRRSGAAGAHFWPVPVAAALIALEVLVSHAAEPMRLRMSTETQDTWYRADITAPHQIALKTDGTITVPITVSNTGRVTWDSSAAPPFRFSYHWITEKDDLVVVYEGLRTAFPAPVAPGTTLELAVDVRAPRQPGRYRLLWDIAQEGRLWFSTETGASLSFTAATISGNAVAVRDVGPLRPLPRPARRPGRFVLWRAAARMLAAHPLLGVGPDNFRLSYGGYASLANADPRVHTNDMYMEVAVGAGLSGALAFVWLLSAAIRTFRILIARCADPRLAPAAGVAAAGLAILVHGVVDSFLGFTPIYVLIAITLGVAVAGASQSAGGPDAHRV